MTTTAKIVETSKDFRIYRNGDKTGYAPYAKMGQTLKEFADVQIANSEKWGWTITEVIEEENSISYVACK